MTTRADRRTSWIGVAQEVPPLLPATKPKFSSYSCVGVASASSMERWLVPSGQTHRTVAFDKEQFDGLPSNGRKSIRQLQLPRAISQTDFRQVQLSSTIASTVAASFPQFSQRAQIVELLQSGKVQHLPRIVMVLLMASAIFRRRIVMQISRLGACRKSSPGTIGRSGKVQERPASDWFQSALSMTIAGNRPG